MLLVDEMGHFVASLNRSVESGDAGSSGCRVERLELDDHKHEIHADRRRCGENAVPQ